MRARLDEPRRNFAERPRSTDEWRRERATRLSQKACFRHEEVRTDEIDERERAGPERRRPRSNLGEGTAEEWPQNEPQVDPRSQPSHGFGAILLVGHVRNRRLARGEVSRGGPGENARREEERQIEHVRSE